MDMKQNETLVNKYGITSSWAQPEKFFPRLFILERLRSTTYWKGYTEGLRFEELSISRSVMAINLLPVRPYAEYALLERDLWYIIYVELL
ncbi:hypothetical protein PT974_04163 [Cladobotryum mycophilum]|uniref:Uncharacterized protein n=1 Tax=Cladobotryum mycophilum TaxID=491253 RepID=A0ABR0SVE9_9HYPO